MSESKRKPKRVFPIVTGGPLHRLMLALRVIRPDGSVPLRPALVAVAFAGLPLIAIGAIQSLVVGRFDPVMMDFTVYARLLIAIPCVLVAGEMLDAHCTLAFGCFVRNGIVAPGSARSVRRIVERAGRLRDSFLPEAIILVAVYGTDLAVAIRLIAPSGWFGALWSGDRSAVHAWYAFVIVPAFQFLFYRWMWHWTIWTRVLFDLSRLPLRLVASHPDRAGGLGLLARPIRAFALLVTGASSVMAAGWYTQIAQRHAHAKAFGAKLLLFVLICELVAFGPTLVFFPALSRARLRGIAQYASLATRLNRAFDRGWVLARRKSAESLLGSPDASSVADFMAVYLGVRQMRAIPLTRDGALGVLAAAVVPMLPVALVEMPLFEFLKGLANALLSGGAG